MIDLCALLRFHIDINGDASLKSQKPTAIKQNSLEGGFYMYVYVYVYVYVCMYVHNITYSATGAYQVARPMRHAPPPHRRPQPATKVQFESGFWADLFFVSFGWIVLIN